MDNHIIYLAVFLLNDFGCVWRKIGGAGLDTFDNEPTPNPLLLNHPRISVSPHIGAATVEAQKNIGLELVDKIIAHFGA